MYRIFEKASEKIGFRTSATMESLLLGKECEIIEQVKRFDSNKQCESPDYLDSFDFFEDDARYILGDVQQAGGITNYIDFTTNIHVALFFACEDYSGHLHNTGVENGRLIVLSSRVHSNEKHHYIIHQRNVGYSKSQSSVFVRPCNGGVLDEKNETVKIFEIPADEKERILRFLKLSCDIDYHTIFDDFRGYIRNQGLVFSFLPELKRRITMEK